MSAHKGSGDAPKPAEAAGPITWESRTVPIAELKAWDRNPRRYTAKQQADLEASLDGFGQAEPIVANTDGTIIGGHFRVHLLRERGTEAVDVRFPSRPLTEDELAELNVRLNRNTGEWDPTLLAGFDEGTLLRVGFEPKELDAIFPAKEARPAPPMPPEPEAEEPRAQRGDIYRLGKHRLMCGDATSEPELRALLGDAYGQVTMVFTDPPYAVGYAGHNREAGDKHYPGGRNATREIKNDRLSPEAFREFLDAVFGNMDAAMAAGAVYYICSGWSSYPAMHYSLAELGFHRAGVIIWEKDNAPLGWQDYRYKHEWVLVGEKGAKRSNGLSILYGWKEGPHFFRSARDEYDVWHVRRQSGANIHPTEKPIWLVEKALANSSQRGDAVLDLFGGSGATLIAAERLGRRAHLMELDEHWVDTIVKRWEAMTGGQAEREVAGADRPDAQGAEASAVA